MQIMHLFLNRVQLRTLTGGTLNGGWKSLDIQGDLLQLTVVPTSGTLSNSQESLKLQIIFTDLKANMIFHLFYLLFSS
jgi:hypothetical protein